MREIRETVPLSVTYSEKIEILRNWAKNRTRSTSCEMVVFSCMLITENDIDQINHIIIYIYKKGVLMKKIIILSVFFIFISGFAFNAHAGLDDFLKQINAKAIKDINNFHASLSNHFGIPVPRVEGILKAVVKPADAFMCLQLGLMTGKMPETVVETYRKNKGKGWGRIAKELGIKPGSAKFHALKRGDFGFYYDSPGKSKGKGKRKKK